MSVLNPAGQLHCGSSARESPGAAQDASEMQLKQSKTWPPFWSLHSFFTGLDANMSHLGSPLNSSSFSGTDSLLNEVFDPI